MSNKSKPTRGNAAKKPERTARERAGRWARKQRGWLISLGVIGAIIGVIVFLSWPSATKATDADGKSVTTGVIKTEGAAPRERRPAPDFVLADYDGKAVRLDEFKGKTVLLNFFASWCTACETEMPDMDRLAKEHPDEFVVLALNQKESKDTSKNFTDSLHVPNVRFALDSNGDVTGAYKLPSGLPHSFFIDKNGTVQQIVHGKMAYADMQSRLAQTVKAGESAVAQ